MLLIRQLLALLSIAITLSLANGDDEILVILPEGQIRGHVLHSSEDKIYYAFQEIPYAEPPVGKLRLQAPVAPKNWNGILNTTENTKICYQSGFFGDTSGFIETEDCLYLNVYSPLKPGDSSKAALPVLVWIHGGAFQNGAGTIQMFNPDFLMDHNIIVVTLNYRVGPLGFLTTEDGIIPGNIGLKDQHFALKWVKKNIHLFGGDPEKITISGESAGGASVGLHLISQKNKGLFRGAILQSGSPVCQWSHQDYARFYAFEVGRNLDPSFDSDDSSDLLTLLQKLPASDINNNLVTAVAGKESGLFEGSLIWLPVTEDENLEGALLTGLFHEDIRTGNIIQVPTLIGFNSEETLLFMNFDPSMPGRRASYLDNDLSNLIKNKYNMTQANKLIAGSRLRSIYTDGIFRDDLGAVVKFSSDELFTTGIIRHAKLQSNYTDVYLYQLSYKGKMGGLNDVEVAGVRGVGHMEDLAYLWGVHLTNNATEIDHEDLVTRHRMLTMWTNFVKYLNPTPECDSLLDNLTWEKATPNNLLYLNINTSLEMEKNPKQYLKWERTIDLYAIPPLANY